MFRRPFMVIALTLGILATAGASVAAHSPGSDGRHSRLPSQIDLPDGWRPEGITSHGILGYVGSLANGAIWRANLLTGAGRVLVPGVSGETAVGLDYDAAHGRIWVAGGTSGEVRVYSARSGALIQTYLFSPAGFVNDVVVTPWAVYATDSNIQQLDVIPFGRHGRLPDPADVTTLALTGDISFVPNAFNANGIVQARGWLIIDQTVNGKLFRVDPRTGMTKEIDTHGADLTTADGMERHGRTLFVARNGANEVAQLELGPRLLDARLVDTLTSDTLDTPTGATFQLGHLWVVNARFTTPPTPTTTYSVTRLDPHHGRD